MISYNWNDTIRHKQLEDNIIRPMRKNKQTIIWRESSLPKKVMIISKTTQLNRFSGRKWDRENTTSAHAFIKSKVNSSAFVQCFLHIDKEGKKSFYYQVASTSLKIQIPEKNYKSIRLWNNFVLLFSTSLQWPPLACDSETAVNMLVHQVHNI